MYVFSYSDLQCLPLGDPRTLCVETGIRLLATHSLYACLELHYASVYATHQGKTEHVVTAS